ncbi:TIGR02221 family CRISPR-associated protein [Aerococcaceae bacterium WS4759]|uniref:TIGR02221 family CRISPR-associated protein n=1 Tax=Fundicoccus ignavus TaxID=2664442 RepID=A0A6I2H163_9LACT|nr:CRISPR-associated protein Csx20 [Fundicoccus ignavus]MRI86363.1 TIGR02221 family CRISPR-associated protein [Fundicoccus ignavus]
MGKKLISFLGTSPYIECHYTYNGETLPPQKYIQASLAEGLCRDWGPEDEIVVLLTPQSKEKNWENSLNSTGLKETLNQTNLQAKVKPLYLKEDVENFEQWDLLFDTIFDVIDDNDEVYFDITHGFRALSLFTQTILNYAKIVKGISVGRILYGNFTALGFVSEVQKMPLAERIAPIVDLTGITFLEDWTWAAESFISSGDTHHLHSLTETEATPIITQTHSQEAKVIRNFTKSLNLFTENIQAVRMQEFPKSVRDMMQNYQQISQSSSNDFKFLHRLFGKIEEELTVFTAEDIIMDQYYAANWANKKGLTQQSYTILEEALTTSVMLAAGYNHWSSYFFNNKKRQNNPIVPINLEMVIRDVVKKAIVKIQHPHRQIKPNPVMERLFEQCVQLLEPYTDIMSRCNVLTEYRNNINHGGMAQSSIITPTNLKGKLNDLVLEIQPFFEVMSQLSAQWTVDQVKENIASLNHPIESKKETATLFVLLSHSLTEPQQQDAREVLKVTEIVTLPPRLQTVWSEVSPEHGVSIKENLKGIYDWILNYETDNKKILLVQGEPGAMVHTVLWGHQHSIQSFYSTSKRVVKETVLSDGRVTSEREFKHVAFRAYPIP